MAAATEAVYCAIGARIRMIRETLGMNQSELAKKIGLTRVSVTNLEAGRQRLQMHQLEKIASGLGLSPRNLLKGIWW